MPVFYLIIGHLLGDFVFQPNSLIKWKFKSWRGTLVHASVITFFSALLLAPYLLNTKAWLLLFLLMLGHFAQDCIKVAYQRTAFGSNHVWPFFLDQFLHILLIFLLGSEFNSIEPIALSDTVGKIYFSEKFQILVSLGIIFTFVLDILKYEFYRVDHLKSKYQRDYPGIWHRLIAFLISYAIFLLVLRISTGS